MTTKITIKDVEDDLREYLIDYVESNEILCNIPKEKSFEILKKITEEVKEKFKKQEEKKEDKEW